MGLSIVAVTINCRDPRSLAEWWAERSTRVKSPRT